MDLVNGFRCLRFPSQLFTDDIVLLASPNSDLQLSLGRFAAERQAAVMRISTSKTEAMVLSWKRLDFPPQVAGVLPPQVEEFKYLKPTRDLGELETEQKTDLKSKAA